jgi:hypothetical protein
MSLSYGEMLYNHQNTCRCGAHTQHRILRFVWKNNPARQTEIASGLKISLPNVKMGLARLRKRRLDWLCPECFTESLVNGVCEKCGFEPFEPVLPIEVRSDSQSPINHIHAGNLLGSQIGKNNSYASLKLHGRYGNDGQIVERRIDRGLENPLIRAVKSDVENELKRSYPSEAITDDAGRLAIKEVLEFRARYPLLAASKNLRQQLALNAIRRLTLLHPQLRRSVLAVGEVTG